MNLAITASVQKVLVQKLVFVDRHAFDVSKKRRAASGHGKSDDFSVRIAGHATALLETD